MLIEIDHREKADIVRRELDARGHSIDMKELKVGDYRIDASLVVERKTIRDFAHSVVDGRLFTQANRLSFQKEAVCLILEGTSREGNEINVTRSAMQGALTTISLIYGIPVLRSMHQQETAGLIEMAANQISRHRMGALKRPGYRPKGERKQKLYFLQGLPGIGPARAEKLLDHFGSLEKLIEADYEDLIDVEFLGPETARKLYKIVRESPPTYGRVIDDL